MPAGPVHDYPASNSQGLGIPKNAKNKKAAWEFIKWALSPEISMRLVKEHGHSSVCRRSVIESETYRKLNTVNGQDLGALYLEVLELPAKGENYMAYRTVKEFPVVGDVINKAVEQVVTGQLLGRRRHERSTGTGGRQSAPCRDRALSEMGIDDERRSFIRWALTPSLIVLFVIAVLPALYLLVISLTPFQLVNPGTATDFSAPFRNYRLLPGDPRFVNSLLVQAKLSFWGVLFQVLLGMLLALLLHTQSRLVEFARSFFLIPMVLPPIVVAVIWKLIYTPDISPIYYAASLLNVTMPSLTSSVDFALVAIIIADTWEWLPFTFLMVLAALQTIPDEYSEAALVDGANKLQIFWYVTLPFIAPILVISAMFRLIDSVKAFPLVFLLTGGGPGSITEVTNYYAYLLAFDNSEIGYSSAVTIVMLLLVTAVSLGVVWMGRRREALT